MSSGPLWLHAALAAVTSALSFWVGMRIGRQQERDRKPTKKRTRTR